MMRYMLYMMSRKQGFTLIEIIIYIALFAFIMGAGVSAAYYIIDSSARSETDVNIVAEAEFLLRKIDWAMTGADSVTAGSMTITKDGTNITFSLISNRVWVSVGGVGNFLTSESVNVSSLEFISIPTTPPGIKASTTINGKHFEITKYIRE